ncbi:hypothetical protein ACM66B_002830 [Microbotryomycetes sp. NB124-2]
MLARTSRLAQVALTRGYRADPLTRLELDILASQAGQHDLAEPRPSVTKSAEAIRGESLRGDVQLPRELQEVVEKAIQAVENKDQIRQHALGLYAHLRSTSSVQPRTGSPTQPLKAQASPTYDTPTSLAFLAGLMPSIYGATLHALTSTRDRLKLIARDGEEWTPERIIDFGCGTASAAWAFDLVWPELASKEYVGVDSSRSMVELGSSVIGALPQRIINDGVSPLSKSTIEARVHQLVLPASRQSMGKLHISSSVRDSAGGPRRTKRTIAIASFALSDISSREKRKEFVRNMWDSGADVIVIIDRGTPAGSRTVIEAREQLLMFGRRGMDAAEEFGVDPDAPAPGSFVLAPCPHDGKCPLHHSTKSFCHFSQRVQSPRFLRQTKHTTRGEDDAKFSYVAVQRGQRPTSVLPEAVEIVDGDETITLEPAVAPPQVSEEKEAEMLWPRLVAPPMKRSGHVILEVCTSGGQLEHHTIPKSQGRQPYYDARKVAWGDTFPHAPKNGPQPAPAVKNSQLVSDQPENKFGPGRSKLRQKKVDRRRGREELDDVDGDGDAARGGDGTGVQEFQMDFGTDGKLHVTR